MTGQDVLREEAERQEKIAEIRALYPEVDFPDPVTEDVYWNPLRVTKIEGSQVIIDSKTGYPMDIVSDRYDLIYHEEVVDTLIKACPEEFGKPDLKMYCWQNGARFRAEAFFPEMGHFEIVSKDFIRPRVRMYSSYDRSMYYGAEFGAEQEICTNGMTAFKIMDKNRRRHIKGGKGINMVADVLRNCLSNFSDQIGLYKRWAEKKLDLPKMQELVEALPYSENEQKKILTEMGMMTQGNKTLGELVAPTVWDVNSAATQFAKHEVNSEQRTLDLEAGIAKVITKAYA